MIKILANDGIHPLAKIELEHRGFVVDTTKVAQEKLKEAFMEYDVLLVRSATKVKEADLPMNPRVKLIGRAGVGLDNIDQAATKAIGIEVFNTPAASSKAVASLTMAMLMSISRNIADAARKMPEKGASDFSKLKKELAGGFELEGKKIGIIGFGRIGQELAKMALGLGMEVMPYDAIYEPDHVFVKIGNQDIKIPLTARKMEDIILHADIISVHVPSQGGSAVLGEAEIERMKKGVILLNTSRGGIIDEDALLLGIKLGIVKAAGLDVFTGEPNPRPELLNHPQILTTPHVGAETEEAQLRIGMEIVERIYTFFGDHSGTL